MSASGSDHWLDLLAVRHTRRHALKAALAGAAFTLPLARSAPALADGSQKCFKGCNFTAHQKYDNASKACHGTAGAASDLFHVGVNMSLGVSLFGVLANPLFVVAYSSYQGIVSEHKCVDTALMQQKVAQFDCQNPNNCGGFDPGAPGGPCVSCNNTGGLCCPDQTSFTGYGCCDPQMGCACGNDTGACHASVTPC
jgi:hypothetical protein